MLIVYRNKGLNYNYLARFAPKPKNTQILLSNNEQLLWKPANEHWRNPVEKQCQQLLTDPGLGATMYTKQWARDRRNKAFQETATEHNFESVRRAWQIEDGGLSLVCRQSRYNTEEFEPFKYRAVDMRIAFGERIMAIALFREWSLADFFPGHQDFIEAADIVTQQDYEMAKFVSEFWDEDDHPLEYDKLMVPHPDPNIWPLLQKGIDKHFSKKMALLILKAFPLEFEGRSGDQSGRNMADLPEFRRRQLAMKRHYRRILDVKNSAGEKDAEGWMWRVLSGPEPHLE
ncbi:hypothetical protein E0H51_31535 [Rhizobium leguminosarum bv. viciae]|uniref:hypothetical protein n=1 Tax=Rhizobium leguminosarum TaxID=384 RepID=UPI001039FAB9|nr:hypothetical protein [Rhizobium leguminosarum]TBY68943.1 hypothetical protein E0H51_31535 [Rhizobium leguminosarum bv. viciae]